MVFSFSIFDVSIWGMEISFYYLCCCVNAIAFVAHCKIHCFELIPNVISTTYAIVKSLQDELFNCCMTFALNIVSVLHL